MVPTGLTIASMFTDATTVVTQFSGLITLVAGLALGLFGVRFLIKQVRKAH